jgi:hypothetical protein
MKKKQVRNPHKGVSARCGEDLSYMGHIPPAVRRFVLQAIGEYKTDEWIVAELKKRWNITRTTVNICQTYRYNKQYLGQIQVYRDRYNEGLEQEPANSKRYILQVLNNALTRAVELDDFSGIAALTKQIKEITGMKAPETVDINHNITGGLTYEKRILQLTENKQAPPERLLNSDTVPPSLMTVEVIPEPETQA